MNGSYLATFADDISRIDIPVVHSSLHNMLDNECKNASNDSETFFVKNLDTPKLPVENDKELEEWMSKFEATAIEYYNGRCAEISNDIKNEQLVKLKARIEDRKKNKRDENQRIKT